MAKGKQAKTAIKSKNDPNARGTGAAAKFFGGKEVIPVLYVGTQLGHGKYIAAAYKEGGKMVADAVTKKPLPWESV